MAISNDAGPDAAGTIVGDPTEVALYLAARDAGVEKPKQEPQFARAAELPFDSERKCMTTLHRHPAGGFISFTKGAVEAVLERSTEVLTSAGPREVRHQELIEVAERMAADGLRA
jgi:Ca2+-transporting ATPase